MILVRFVASEQLCSNKPLELKLGLK